MGTINSTAPVKGNAPVKSNVSGIKNAFWVIIACFIVAVCAFLFFFGAPSHFEYEGEPGASMWFFEGEAHPKDLIGTIFKGGIIVPVLQTLFLTVIVLSVERYIALSSAKGKGNITKFVNNVKVKLQQNDIAGALALCKTQKGSVAAVVSAALIRYEEMDKNTVLTKEQKVQTLQKEVEEATAMEMPTLQQNLPIVATLTTLGTLVGLLGTVIGMIKSFQALSASGAPDSTALSTGISEALVNTAFGIATGAFAVISYNYYTNKIDNLTYAIDEIGFSIVQTFQATH
ncbi:MAG: MotA/TolQ/ExbB proton channel family protein [Muribaculaceae bacterium]|nr:MotA/TolQ/ExbB proton channel family protein [Muribaculaceae bacterium]